MKLLSLTLVFWLSVPALASDLQVVVSGKYFDKGSVELYRVASMNYLPAKAAGSIYGARVYWYPVSGKVVLSLHNEQLQFFVDSDEAKIGSQSVKLPAPVLLRASQAFIPLYFFLSPAFSDVAGMDSTYNAEMGLLTADKRVTVGPVRWLSYRDFTRVLIELKPGVTYQVSKRGRGGVEASFAWGKCEGAENISVRDGIVDGLQLKQEPKTVRLALRFQVPSASWQAREESSPRRLVIDVAPPGAEAVLNAAKSQPSTQAPDAPKAAATEPSKAVSGAPAISTAVAVSSAPVAAPKGAKRRIVIDAGHGGKDSGTAGKGAKEKDVNLKAALELAELLKQEGAFEVLLTRPDDTFVPLSDRSDKANQWHADLFISLHCNAASRKNENGFELYVLAENASDPESERVAATENAVLRYEGKTVEDEEAAAVLHGLARDENTKDATELAGLMGIQLSKRVDIINRGVRHAAFYVLRGTDAPAVLVEMGYLTNKKEAAKLQSKKVRQKIITGLYAGILEFAGRRHWGSN